MEQAQEAFQELKLWRAIGRTFKVAGDQVVECVCDYGESVGRVLCWLFKLIVLFALLYGAIWGVWTPWQTVGGVTFHYTTRNIWHLLAFSLGAMTTIGPPGLEPRETLAMQILMPVQALLGIVLAGLLGFVLGNRIRRS